MKSGCELTNGGHVSSPHQVTLSHGLLDAIHLKHNNIHYMFTMIKICKLITNCFVMNRVESGCWIKTQGKSMSVIGGIEKNWAHLVKSNNQRHFKDNKKITTKLTKSWNPDPDLNLREFSQTYMKSTLKISSSTTQTVVVGTLRSPHAGSVCGPAWHPPWPPSAPARAPWPAPWWHAAASPAWGVHSAGQRYHAPTVCEPARGKSTENM